MTTLTAEARTAGFDLSFNLSQIQQHAELAEASTSSRMQDLTARRAEAESQASQLEAVVQRAEKMASELPAQLEAFLKAQKETEETLEAFSRRWHERPDLGFGGTRHPSRAVNPG